MKHRLTESGSGSQSGTTGPGGYYRRYEKDAA